MTTALPTAPVAASSVATHCPFHQGAATLDALLADLGPGDVALFDAALDLRSLATAGTDAAACVEQLFRIRALLDGRHYLAFYRVRCWARRTFQIEVRAHRSATWSAQALPLDGGHLDEIVNASLATLAEDGVIPSAAHVRFAFSGAQ